LTAPNSVSNEIASVLRTEILRGQYRVGERLASERDLAARFDASRGAVREALSQLELIGIIDILPGGGRVQSYESGTLAVLGHLLVLDGLPDAQLVDQFLQVFGMLSSQTAKSAIEKADEGQLAKLGKMLQALSENVSSFEQMEPHWREMLEYLAIIDNNLVMRLISNDLKAQFVEQMMASGIKPDLKLSAGTELFNTLKQCLITRDGDRAAKAFQKHFTELRKAVLEAIQIKQEAYRKEAV